MMRSFVKALTLVAGLALAGLGLADKAERLALPTPEQAAWQDMELGLFIHFAPNTWQDREYDDHSTPLSAINPDRLDTDQWVSVAEAMGAKYIVFVAKHVGGFCMWQTDTTAYGIKSTPWRGGQGDVLADLAESCRKRSIRLGVYLSPRDDTHGAAGGGQCPTPEAQAAYNTIYRRQLTEVLGRYGEMAEVWFDGSNVIDVADILKAHAPRAMIFQGPRATIRWVGNEDGVAPCPAWNAVSETAARSGVATAADGNPSGAVWLPNECDARMRDTWFWNSKNAHTLKSVDALIEMYYLSVGRGANLLLNHTPDPAGRIPDGDARRAAEFGAEVRRRFGRSLAETQGSGPILELELDRPACVDHAILMEDIRRGERVRSYVLAGLAGRKWIELSRGSAIGHKKIDRFPPEKVAKVRLYSLVSVGRPEIRKLAVYSVAALREDP